MLGYVCDVFKGGPNSCYHHSVRWGLVWTTSPLTGFLGIKHSDGNRLQRKGVISVCVCVCVRACVRVCVCARVCVWERDVWQNLIKPASRTVQLYSCSYSNYKTLHLTIRLSLSLAFYFLSSLFLSLSSLFLQSCRKIQSEEKMPLRGQGV